MEKIKTKIENIDDLLTILAKLMPHFQHNLLLTGEINDRNLEPMKDIFRSYENITKNKDELIELIKKNKVFNNEKLKYYNELVLRQNEIDKELFLTKLIIDFLVEKKIIDGYYDTSKRSDLDNITTYDKNIQKLQRKDIKENEKKS